MINQHYIVFIFKGLYWKQVSKVWLKKLSSNCRLWKRMCRLQGIEVSHYHEDLTESVDQSLDHRAKGLNDTENAKETPRKPEVFPYQVLL